MSTTHRFIETRSTKSLNQYGFLFSVPVTILSAGCLIGTPYPLIRILSFSYLALLLPGLSLLAAFFPDREKLPPSWRLALILTTSLAVTSGAVLLTNYFWVYKYVYVIVLIAFIDIGLALLAQLRRKGLEPIRRSTINLNTSRLPRIFWFSAFILSLGIFLISIIYSATIPKQTYKFTQFYVLTPEKKLPMHISSQDLVNSGLLIGLGNFENKKIYYQIIVIAHQGSEQFILWSDSILLDTASSIEIPFRPANIPGGVKQLELFLIKNNDPALYRSLLIPVD